MVASPKITCIIDLPAQWGDGITKKPRLLLVPPPIILDNNLFHKPLIKTQVVSYQTDTFA